MVLPSPTPTATPVPTRRLLFTPTPIPTSRTATGTVTYENPILGYRIDLPEDRRRSSAGIAAGSEDGAGQDRYTATTEAEDRAACLTDGGHLPSMDGEPVLYIGSWRNPAGLSAEVWAQPLSTHMLVERTTIDGREAVRLVRDQQTNHESTTYVIRANDRMYVLRFESDNIPSRLPGWLDRVAATFRAVQPGPFPTATPPPAIAPRDAARDIGQRLSLAFGARDVDAIAGLITPRCHLGTVPYSPPGTGVGGSARAVVPFLDALRAALARGELKIAVDPEVQVEVQGTGAFRYEQLFVRSDWTASGLTMRIDLFLTDVEGRQYWTGARYYQVPRAECTDLRVIFAEGSGSRC